MDKDKIGRRDFVKIAMAGATVLAAPKLFRKSSASESESEGENTPRWAMVIDQAKCSGCGNCIEACRANNDINPDMAWSRVTSDNKSGEREAYLPIQCMHCEHAPCVHVCPVKATYHRPDGIVMMDYDRCIGCRYCEISCPYGARVFNWEEFDGENPAVAIWGEPEVERRPRGVVEKCTFCYQRIDRGLEQGLTPGVDREVTPACVAACPMGARTFGDLNDPDSPVSRLLDQNHSCQLREDLGTKPRIYYLHVSRESEESTS